MKKSFRALLIIMLAAVVLFTSCSKKDEAPAEVQKVETPAKAEAVPAAKGGEKVTEPVPAVKSEPVHEFAKAIPEVIKTDLDKFAYAYGWGLMEAIQQQGLIPNGQYFARGVMDCVEMKEETLVPIENIMTVLQEFLADFQGGGERGEFAELEAIQALGAPSTPEEEFAYAYGFYNTFGIMQQMIEIDGVWFPRGALDNLFEREPRIPETEIPMTINGYFEAKEAEYRAWLEKEAAKNLDLAEKMLASKKSAEGNIVISDQLVIEPISTHEGEAVMADPEDSVTVNYTLRDIHGNTMDHGDGITFPLSGVIPGFRDACLSMAVGDHIYAYVHPSIGYGEYGTGNIAPNSLLVFEIELVDVLAEM